MVEDSSHLPLSFHSRQTDQCVLLRCVCIVYQQFQRYIDTSSRQCFSTLPTLPERSFCNLSVLQVGTFFPLWLLACETLRLRRPQGRRPQPWLSSPFPKGEGGVLLRFGGERGANVSPTVRNGLIPNAVESPCPYVFLAFQQ